MTREIKEAETLTAPNHELVKKILAGFETLGIAVDFNQVATMFQKQQKIGNTNNFFHINANGKEYIIRINGKLWEPYTRKQENQTLNMLKEVGLETGVLFNGDDFQICDVFPKKYLLFNIISSGDQKAIEQAAQLIAKEMSKYQSLNHKGFLTYPIEKMIADAKVQLMNKIKDMPISLKKLIDGADKIIFIFQILEYLGLRKKFNHNDLFSSSIYVDINNSKVIIVDWEYAAYSWWSNDLAILTRDLSLDNMKLFANAYRQAKTGSTIPMSEDELLVLQANRFLHNFLLGLAWKVNSKNLPEYQNKINEMENELNHIYVQLKVKFGIPVPEKTNLFRTANAKTKTHLTHTSSEENSIISKL